MLRSSEASFLGSHNNKIDAKGRVAAPADFRRALEGEPLRGFFCLPSLQGAFLECGGGDFVAELKTMIRALDPYDPDREALEEHVLGAMRPLTFDTEGRFILPEQFRSHAGLGDRALFVGRGDTFVIRTPESAADRLTATRDAAKAALRRLRNPGTPPESSGAK